LLLRQQNFNEHFVCIKDSNSGEEKQGIAVLNLPNLSPLIQA
jgi:hypothetical protein